MLPSIAKAGYHQVKFIRIYRKHCICKSFLGHMISFTAVQ